MVSGLNKKNTLCSIYLPLQIMLEIVTQHKAHRVTLSQNTLTQTILVITLKLRNNKKELLHHGSLIERRHTQMSIVKFTIT